MDFPMAWSRFIGAMIEGSLLFVGLFSLIPN